MTRCIIAGFTRQGFLKNFNDTSSAYLIIVAILALKILEPFFEKTHMTCPNVIAVKILVLFSYYISAFDGQIFCLTTIINMAFRQQKF